MKYLLGDLTVIIPAFNEEKTILDTLKSIKKPKQGRQFNNYRVNLSKF